MHRHLDRERIPGETRRLQGHLQLPGIVTDLTPSRHGYLHQRNLQKEGEQGKGNKKKCFALC